MTRKYPFHSQQEKRLLSPIFYFSCCLTVRDANPGSSADIIETCFPTADLSPAIQCRGYECVEL